MYSYTCGLTGYALYFAWYRLRFWDGYKVQRPNSHCRKLVLTIIWEFSWGWYADPPVLLHMATWASFQHGTGFQKPGNRKPQSSYSLGPQDLECHLCRILLIGAVRRPPQNYREVNYTLPLFGRMGHMYRDRRIDGSHLWRQPQTCFLNSSRRNKRKLWELPYNYTSSVNSKSTQQNYSV